MVADARHTLLADWPGGTPRPTADPVAFVRVRQPVTSGISKRLYRQFSQDVCPWNLKFATELPDGSPFAVREVIAGKDARTLADEVLSMYEETFRTVFKKSPIKRAKLAGLQRNARVHEFVLPPSLGG